jgi:hypothetical protein
MAKRGGERRGGSGTDGGTDVEPLHGGMAEVSRDGREPSAELDDRHAARKDPPAPYHATETSAGGLAPSGSVRSGTQGGGATPRQGTPPNPGEAGESARGAGKARETRDDHQNDAANAPRGDERRQDAPEGGVPTQGYTLPHGD